MRKLVLTILSVFAATLFTIININIVFAHRDGCHRWHSCPSDSGSYTCGDLGYTSECGAVISAPVYIPRVPVKTTQTITREESIPFKTITRYDYREYPGYTKVKTAGSLGVKVVTTTVSSTDDVETGRSDTSNAVTRHPVDKVTIEGGRSKPLAKIYGIADSDPGFWGLNRGKFNIWGKYKANSRVYLYVDKVERSNARSNEQGWFTFNNVRVDKEEAWLHVFERTGDNIITISEKTKVNTVNKRVTTEYMLLHPVKDIE